jgi:hypothetical protein
VVRQWPLFLLLRILRLYCSDSWLSMMNMPAWKAPPGYISTTKLAHLAGTSAPTALKWAKSELYEARQIGKRWAFPVDKLPDELRKKMEQEQ